MKRTKKQRPSANFTLNYLEDRSDAKITAGRLVEDGIATFARMQLDQDRNKCDIDRNRIPTRSIQNGELILKNMLRDKPQILALERLNLVCTISGENQPSSSILFYMV